MRRFFCLWMASGWLLAHDAAAQAVPTCHGDEPPATDLRRISKVGVSADSAFASLRVAALDFDSVSARFRVRVQRSGAVEVLCAYAGPGGGAAVMTDAARRLRFTRDFVRPFGNIATVDVTIAVLHPLHGEPVAEVRRTVSVGQGVRVELAYLPAGPGTARFSRADSLAIYAAALGGAGPMPHDSGAVRCVGFRGGNGPAAALARMLSSPGKRMVPQRECPPKRFTQVVRVDARGRPIDPPPPGWIDPVEMELGTLQAWSEGSAAITLRVSQSTITEGYTCVVTRDSHRRWTADCRNEWRAVAVRVDGGRAPLVHAAKRLGETRSG